MKPIDPDIVYLVCITYSDYSNRPAKIEKLFMSEKQAKRFNPFKWHQRERESAKTTITKYYKGGMAP